MNVFECYRFVELLCWKEKKFHFLIFYPLEFFENKTLKWVALVGLWIKIIFFIFFIHFLPRGTTQNLTFLNTQNRPTLFCRTRRKWNHIQQTNFLSQCTAPILFLNTEGSTTLFLIHYKELSNKHILCTLDYEFTCLTCTYI